MKKKLLSLLLSTVMALSGVSVAAGQSLDTYSSSIPAFPGAEGGGMYATGGRGGTVVYVTNLNDSGTGSFREAVSGSNRIVVFKVGGTIELKSDVVVKSNVTIAGQTAPGGAGITLKNYKVGLGGSNIIMRFINSRPGERGTSADYDALGGSDGSNSIVDHCSFGWANDEQWGLYSQNDNATTQYCIIGPSNSFSYHSKGIHGFGVMFGRANHSMHHNLIVHNVSRNFRGKVTDTNTVDFVNNVIYNWGYQTAYGTLGHLNYVGNYLKMGPSTAGGYQYVAVGNSGTDPENYSLYLTGNKFVDKNDADYSTLSSDNWTGISYGSSSGKNESNTRSDSAFAMTVNGQDVSVATTAESADDAYAHVLAYAGSGINAESRTAIDKQVMEEVSTGTGTLTGARPYSEASSSQKETLDKYNITCGVEYEYPETNTDAVTDSDSDGMPDDWEIERGLNPYSKYADDGSLEANGDYCGQGYTNIEYYINDLTVDAFPEGVVTVSPTLGKDITVDPDAAESEEDEVVKNTITSALEYAAANNTGLGTTTITVKGGTYNEDIVVDTDNIILTSEGNVTVNSITANADSLTCQNITANTITLNGDKAVFENCTAQSVVTTGDGRAYFNGCTLNVTDVGVQGNQNMVFENCTISGSGSIAMNTADITGMGMLFWECDISGLEIYPAGCAILAYYNCTMNNITRSETSASEESFFFECNSTENGGTYTSTNITEYNFLEKFMPFFYTCGDDNWNPGGWDEVTPQTKLSNLADTLSVPSLVVTETTLATGFSDDSDVTVSWVCDNSERFSNNTIIPMVYGEGTVKINLTATVSKTGMLDEVRTFEVTVGSTDDNGSAVIDFNDETVGATPSYFADSASDDTVTGYVTDNINGVTFSDRGNFFGVWQTALSDTIHNFTYDFGTDDDGERVIEVGYDVYMGENITDASYFESYVRGDSVVAQMRYTVSDGDNSILAYNDSSTKTELASGNSAWYTVKMIVSSEGVGTGTAPQIDYYLYDENGNLVSSLLKAAPAKDYTADTASAFIPSKLVFRPNRKLDNCEFYVDNIYMKDLSELVEEDAQALSLGTLEMSDGASLPQYGNHMTDVTWRVVDGYDGLVNSDGTINYDLCQSATVKVKASVAIGDSITASADSGAVTLNITGTGTTNPTTTEKTFSDTESFSDWIPQYEQESNVSLNNTDSVAGNSTTKIKLADKAVFRPFESAVGTGEYTFTADMLYNADSTNTSGRSFRIYFENAATGNSGGKATEAFATTNIFYQIMNYGNVARVVTSDEPSANAETGVAVGTLEDGCWYRIQVDFDMDEGTAVTTVYKHSSDGTYNPDGTMTEIGTAETSFINKTPLELMQIRLVRTAASTVYFDNIQLAEATDDVTDVFTYGDANGDDTLTAADAATILQKVLNASFTMGIESLTTDYMKYVDVNGDDELTASDAANVLQKVLNNSFKFAVE